MVSIADSGIKLDVSGSIIDCNWYYGCLLSPRKCIDIDAILSLDVGHDDDHRDGSDNNHSIAEDGKREDCIAEEAAMNERRFRDNRNDTCFGLGDFDSAKAWKEDADEEAECLANMFRVLDEDGDGRVSADEMMRFLQRLNLEMPTEDVESAVRSVSARGDAFLTALEFAEFYRLIFDSEEEANQVNLEDEAIYEAFGVFDQNGDGFISALELADVLRRLGFLEGRDVNCCQSMIERVDCNGDGVVDIHEFRHLITRTTPSLHPSLQ